jgi:hypothetical protein
MSVQQLIRLDCTSVQLFGTHCRNTSCTVKKILYKKEKIQIFFLRFTPKELLACGKISNWSSFGLPCQFFLQCTDSQKTIVFVKVPRPNHQHMVASNWFWFMVQTPSPHRFTGSCGMPKNTGRYIYNYTVSSTLCRRVRNT